MVLYVASVVLSIKLARPMAESWLRTALLLTPLIPLFLSIWVMARAFGRMDEFVRLRSLESIAVGAAVTAACSFTYGFLELVGFPRLSMFWVWPVMGLAWAATSAARALFSR
jgi:hypothetical protein